MAETIAVLHNWNVGKIAAQLPGATSVFRRFGIDFCCHGDVALAEAAHQRGVDLTELETALGALDPTAAPQAPQETGALIEHIKTRYHNVHRQQIPELIELSRKVEGVHAAHPNVPTGLADLLHQIWGELEVHMKKEELMLFPAMEKHVAVTDRLVESLGGLRHDHNDQGAILEKMAQMTNDYHLPEGACRSWQALYTGVMQLKADLMEHIHLENNVLFPRFETKA